MEVARIDAMVAHQPGQRGAVAIPVGLAQARRFVLVDAEMPLDVFPHRAVDVRKDVRRRVVEGVVEVEQPGALHPAASPGQCDLIIVPTP